MDLVVNMESDDKEVRKDGQMKSSCCWDGAWQTAIFPSSVCLKLPGKGSQKVGKGGNWETILEKPEFVCPWKSP